VFTDIDAAMTEVRSGQEALVERRLLRRARSDTCNHNSSSRQGVVLTSDVVEASLEGGGRCSSCQLAHPGRVLCGNNPLPTRVLLAGSISDEPDVDGLQSLAALDHVDGYPLAFRKLSNAAAVERRGMHENVFAAAIPDDEPEPFIRVVPLYRTDLLDGDLIRALVRPFGSWAARLFLQRGAGVDSQDLGYLHALLTRRRPDFKGCAGWHRAVAAALDHAHVKKGIAAAWQLDEAKALFGVVPLHCGRNRRAGRSRFEAGAALTRRIPEIRRRRVVIIIEASPLRSPGISIFAHAPLGCAGQAR
jgi:hypothetical protein